MSVPYDIMGDTKGHNVCQSLYLMDDSISVGHLGAVLHCWGPVISNHLVNLLMNLGCNTEEDIPGKATGKADICFHCSVFVFICGWGGACARASLGSPCWTGTHYINCVGLKHSLSTQSHMCQLSGMSHRPDQGMSVLRG